MNVALDPSAEGDLAGLVVDCRSFPPGPENFFLRALEPGGVFGTAATPARCRLSLERLDRLHPELTRPAGLITRFLTVFLTITSHFGSGDGAPGWIGRLVGEYDPDGQAEAVETLAQMLHEFDAEPAVVLSAEPLLVAAWAEAFDAPILLRLPSGVLDRARPDGSPTRAEPGARLIVVHGYGFDPEPNDDIVPGPHPTGHSNNAWPVLVDPLTDDSARLDELKSEISEERWQRCRAAGAALVRAGQPSADQPGPAQAAARSPKELIRDGRPWCSRVRVSQQGDRRYRRRGGYLR
jgi:hypothetical protein